MILFQNLFLATLMLFGAFNPAAYADCCQKESSEKSCCVGRGGKEGREHEDKSCSKEEIPDCHTTNQLSRNDGMQHFSCCMHLPQQFVNDFTSPVQVRVHQPEQENYPIQFNILFLHSNSSIKITWENPESFRGLVSPPGWLSFRNIRC